MSDGTLIHIDEESLECYAMGRPFESPQLEALEGHLLLCPRCQSRLERLDGFLKATRVSAQEILDKEARKREKSAWPAYAARAAILAVAASVAFFVWAPKQADPALEPVTVAMVSARQESQVSAPAGRPLRFQFDLTGLETSGPSLYEVIGSDGELIQRHELSRNEANPPLPAGRYWIRIKATPNGPSLREFALNLR